MQQPLIILDCERMRYPNTGLFHFCLHLSKTMLQQHSNYKMGLYLPEYAKEHFHSTIPTLKHQSWHKFYMPFINDIDIWHTTYQSTNYFPATSKAKIVLTVHDLNVLHEQKPAAKKKKFLRSLQRKLERADAITVISEYVKQDLLKHTQITGKKIHVIHNGCTIDATLQLSLPSLLPTAPFFFTIGTIIDKKNFHVLPGLLVNNDYQLVIAGIVQSENYKKKILQVAKRLGVEDRLIFTGGIQESEKYWYMQNCAAFAFPSLSEGFGLPVIEAMYFGKTVLLSGATCLPEIGGPHAYYFDNFEPAHMTHLAFGAMKDVRVNNKSKVISQWTKRFSWHEAAKAYSEIYEGLLK